MRPIDLIRLAGQNLWRRRMRTMLTVLGVVIGTASLMLMVALGLANMAQMEKQYARLNLNKIEIYSYSQNNTGAQLNNNAISTMQALPGVKAASPVLNLTFYAELGKYEAAYLNVNCVDPAVLEGITITDGAMYSSASAMPEILLGADAKLNFQDPKNPVDYYRDWDWSSGELPKGPELDWLNESLTLSFGGKYMLEEPDPELPAPRSYRGKVAGLLEGENYESYMSLSLGKQILMENRKLAGRTDLNRYDRAIVIASEVDQVESIVAAIKAMGFEAYSPAESIQMMKEEQARQQGQLLMISLISLLVSAIGIANTMLASILERRAEIGVMKVVGMGIPKIRLLFLTEAAMIGLVGGMTGTLIAYLIAFFVNSGTGGGGMFLGMYFGEGVQLLIPFWLTLAASGVAIATGILSGVYPAYQATKMSPLEAIRG